MAPHITIRVDPEIKERLNKLARMEGKTTSQMVRELIEKYVKEQNVGIYIDDLWSRIGGQFKSKEVKQRDIARAITEARKR